MPFPPVKMMSSHRLLISLWLAGVVLEGLLLFRALASGWFKKYPFFFAYLASVFVQEFFLLAIYRFRFSYYARVYWFEEFVSLAMGCGITWEIFRVMLERYPGAGKMARNVLLIVLSMILSKGLVSAWYRDVPWPTTGIELEGNLRAIQALALIVLAVLIVYYQIPIGRNIKGIFIGYGLFIATSVVTLTLRGSLGKTFQIAWVLVQPMCYLTVLFIWCRSLWEYEAAPPAESQFKIESDYRLLTLATRKGLIQARTLARKVLRP
jgi:hypothetical protein